MRRFLLTFALILLLASPALPADISMDVDTAVTVPCNKVPLVDATDGKTLEVAIAYNEAGMNVAWNFVTTAGAMTTTAVTPTTAGLHDWLESGTDEGMYKIEIPASGGTVNNDTEGTGWLSGTTTTCLPFSGPIIEFRAAGINNVLIDSAYSATRGLSGTALPNAAADAAGGLPISDAGGLALDDIPITAEFEARTLASADYTIVADLGTVQSGDTYAALPANFSDLSITVTAGLVSLAASQTYNMTGNITGNLSGSVGSVSGAVGSVTGAVGSVAGNVDGNVSGSVATCAAATVSAIGANVITDAACAADFDTLINDEVKDVMETDTHAEPTGKADFPAVTSYKNMFRLGYVKDRNKTRTSSTEYELFNDAGVAILDQELSDDGTDFVATEIDDDD